MQRRLLITGSVQVCLLLLLAASLSCSESGPIYSPVDPDFSDIEDPYERWQAYDLQDYRIKEGRHCFCPGPFGWTAYVRKGEVVAVSINDPQYDTKENRERLLAGAWTVEEAFARAEQIKNSGADIAIVEYDEQYGFPRTMTQDWEGVVDGGVTYVTQDLEAVVKW